MLDKTRRLIRNGQTLSEEKREGAAMQLSWGSTFPFAWPAVPEPVPCDRMSALFKCNSNHPAYCYKHMNLRSG